MTTDAQWKQLYLHIHTAAESMQDDFEERYVPSPSSIASCRLRQWFQGNHFPRTNRIPVDSLKKMESGTVIEQWWRDVYSRAGFLVVSPTPALTIGAMQSKGGDGLMFVETESAANALGLPIGSSLLLELKDLGAWSYMDVVQKGVKEGLPDYWMQIQSYLHGYNREYCIFHAGMADSSGTKWIWKRIRKQTEDIPPFWIEIIKRDPSTVLNALSKASEIKHSIDNIQDRIPLELRDYDAPSLVAQGKYPCGYCGYADTCVAAGRGSLHIVGDNDGS